MDLIAKLKESKSGLVNALRATGDLGGDIVRGTANLLDPRQLVPGTDQFLPKRMGELGTSTRQAADALAYEMAGPGGFAASAMSADTSTRNAELAGRILGMARAGRLDKSKARRLLASLPEGATMGDANVAAAFEAGMRLGLGSMVVLGSGEAIGGLAKKVELPASEFDQEAAKLDAEIKDLNARARSHVEAWRDTNDSMRQFGSMIEGDKKW